MAHIEVAGRDDVEELVLLETGLFEEDAGVHERFADVTWPVREGAADFTRLIGDESSIVLIARHDGTAIGVLVGYLTASSPTRLPVTYAVLRSLFVDPGSRDRGVGETLVGEFLSWAREQGCAQATVDSYAENVGAQRFYERLGFVAHSVSRVLPLDDGTGQYVG